MQKSLTFILFVFFLTTCSLFAQSRETIRVGVFLDMSGETSSFGIASFNGIKMAVSEINNSGGVNGWELEVFLVDTLGRPENAQEAVKKLIAERNIHILIGDVASTNSLAGGYVAQNAKIPMISPSAGNPIVTQLGNYVFRACFVDPPQGAAMAKFAFDGLKLRRVAILSDSGSDYSRFLAETFRNTFTRLGGKVVVEKAYSQIDTDFKTTLKSIRKTKVDSMYLPGYYGQVGIIAKQTRELGMTMPLLGGGGWYSPELWKLGGEALKNSYVSGHFAIDDPALKSRHFVRKYESNYHSNPDELAALGYDAVYLLADAVGRAKSLDSPVLRDALAATTDFYGVTGRIVRFDSFRNPIKPVVILKLDPKTSTFVYNTTIQP